MTEKFCEGTVPAGSDADDGAELGPLRDFAERLPERYEEAMSVLDFGTALEAAWDLIKQTNKYIEESAPWALAKSDDDRPRLEAVMYNALEAVRIAALFCAPVMPETSAEVWRRLGLGDIHEVADIASEAAWGGLPAGSTVVKGEPLYPRIVDED
jgi:methionyl-tRNA synthetase